MEMLSSENTATALRKSQQLHLFAWICPRMAVHNQGSIGEGLRNPGLSLLNWLLMDLGGMGSSSVEYPLVSPPASNA